MSKVLVFGANSFSGRHFQAFFSHELASQGHVCVGVVREQSSQSAANIFVPELRGDVIRELIVKEKPDYIVNFIGGASSSGFDALYAKNAGISREILAAAVDASSVNRVLLVGSAAAYGVPRDLPVAETAPLEPVTDYGLVKVMQEHYAQYYHRVHGLEVCVARTFNVLGAGMPESLAIPSFIGRIAAASNNVEVGDLETSRDYLTIEDVVRGYWQILQKGQGGEAYNVCSGRSVRMRELFDFICERLDKKLTITVDSKKLRPGEVKDSRGGNDKLVKLGWSPRGDIFASLESMIREVVVVS